MRGNSEGLWVGGVVLAVMLCASASAQGVNAIPADVITSQSDSGYAVYRLTVVDSAVGTNPKLSPSTRDAIKKAIEAAKETGAVEKEELVTFSLSMSTIMLWRTLKGAPSKSPLSAESRKLLAAERLSSRWSELWKGLLPLVPSHVERPRRGRIATEQVNGAAITVALPGMSATKPMLSSTTKDVMPELMLLEQGSAYSDSLLNRVPRQSTSITETGPPAEPRAGPRVAVPLAPVKPTLPVLSYQIQIPCNEREAFEGLLGRAGVRPIFNACPDDPSSLYAVSVDQAGLSQPANGHDAYPDDEFLHQVKYALETPYVTGAPVPLLVIFDDGFPSDEDYQRTKSFFEEVDAKLLTQAGADVRWQTVPLMMELSDYLSDAERKGFPAQTRGPRGREGCAELEADACKMHSKAIKTALYSFTSLVTGKEQPVRVIWVPFFFSQPGAAQVAYKISRFNAAIPDEFATQKIEYSDAAFNQFKAQYAKMVQRIGVGYPQKKADWNISLPYVGNVIAYFRAYSALFNTPVFLNLSWRASSNVKSHVPGRGQSKLLMVAAAGNPCTEGVTCLDTTDSDFEVGGYQFLRQAADNDKNLYVVANTDKSGHAVCDSARLSFQENFFAFPGGIGTECGTSFSAPRLAWLLASYERYRTGISSVPKDQEGNIWVRSLKARLSLVRNPELCAVADDMRCLMLRTEWLFPGMGPKPSL